MWGTPRNMARVVALGLILWAHSGAAVELATPQVASFQGQNLNAFVDLQELQGPQASLQARMGAAEDYAAMQLPRYTVVEQISVDVVEAPLGGARLSIRSSRPIVEPRLQLVVRLVDAAEVQLRRLSLAIPAPLTSSYAADLQEFTPSLAQQDDPARRTRLTREKDTLWSVAKNSRESSTVTTQQQMLAIVRLNPDAFIAENVNGLKSGYLLRLPELFEASLLTASAALREVKRQYKSWVDEGYARAPTTISASTEDSRRLRILDPADPSTEVSPVLDQQGVARPNAMEPGADAFAREIATQTQPRQVRDEVLGATEPDSIAQQLELAGGTEESAVGQTSRLNEGDPGQSAAAENTDADAAVSQRTMPLPKAATNADAGTEQSQAEKRQIPMVPSAKARDESMSPGLVAIVSTVLLTLALLLMAWRRRRNKGSASEAKSAQPEQSGQEDEFAVREPTVANLDADTAAMLDDLDPEPAGDSAVSPRKKPLLVSPSSLPSMTGSSSDDEDIIETRIKLAIAFAEVGDEQGARELLQEVLEEGDEEQRMAAQLLIDELDDQN